MSRTKQEIVDFYAAGLAEFGQLFGTQYDAMRMTLLLACAEMEWQHTAAMSKLYDQLVDANNEAVRLKKANLEAEEEIGRLCSELQALEATRAQAFKIQLNGTHPADTQKVDMQAVKKILQEPPAFDAEAAQEAAGEAQPDPTTPAGAGEKGRPAEYKWPTLDDVSLEIVTAMTRKHRQWQSVTPDDKRIIVLAMIGELSQDLPPGETLSIETFNRHKPRWMPMFPSVSISLGMTWRQMLAAAPQL